MKTKTKMIGSPTQQPPALPLVRGPRNKKEKGELAELAFLYKAAGMGFGVAKPYGDSERYDFVLDSGERFWRVQVKSASSRAGRGLTGYVVPSHTGRGRSLRPYKPDEIDFLVAYIVPRDIWYVVPVNQIAPFQCLSFYPSGCRIGGYFESYREAWHLLAPGGDVPQPGTLRRVRTIDLHRKHFVE
jgi:PD-(D/E)XK endonuclease